MSKVRVYEVARDLGIENKALVALFQSVGVTEVRNHMSAVAPEQVERVKRHLEKATAAPVVEERIRPTVVKRRAVKKPKPEPVAEAAAPAPPVPAPARRVAPPKSQPRVAPPPEAKPEPVKVAPAPEKPAASTPKAAPPPAAVEAPPTMAAAAPEPPPEAPP
ncbi:MAG TPA: translation initiation factor IF-2 N-terminal domain-containing protein, partial [Polyangiaceae bacterium]|nr:translation initiation factor IF-2 N-terminal domain-containing protein [Polyangiaceae bacterium]